MLALSLTFLAAAFILGPDLLFRWVLSFVVPRRSISQNRGEEITRAIFWALGPLLLVLVWVRLRHVLQMWGRWSDVEAVFSGLYSNAYFDAHMQAFYASLLHVLGMAWSLLWRLYLIVILCAGTLDLAIVRYRWLRGALRSRWAQAMLTMIVLPRVSEWHVLLSDMLLPSDIASLALDVLTRNGTLYQGHFQDKMLGPDGSLQTLTLADPRRFQREEFHRACEMQSEVSRESFWRPIDGKLFVIFGTDIASVNVRYLTKEDKTARITRPELTAEDVVTLRGLLQKLVIPVEDKPKD